MERPFAAYNGDGEYIFVCYAHEDAERVYPLIDWMAANGLNIWYDEGISPGHEWTQELAERIAGCSRFLYFVSPTSVASRNCRNEIQYAMARDKHFISVHMEPTQLPGGLELSIGLAQAIMQYDLQPKEFERKLLDAFSGGRSLNHVASGKLSATAPSTVTNRRWPLFGVGLTLAVLIGIGWVSLRQPAPEAQVPAAVETSAPLTAIAVMPFDDLSPGGDQTWLANGMTEELIESLSRIEGLQLPGRGSTSSLQAAGADARAVGEALDVGSMVTGSVQRSGEKIAVTVRWIRISDQTPLWSARHSRTLDDIFEVQKEIAVGIAEAIRAELGIRVAIDFLSQQRYQTSDVRAWEYVQRGAELIRQLTPEKLAEGRELMKQALELDPNYILAESMLAFSNFENPAERVAGAQRIMERDPGNAVASQILIAQALRGLDYQTARSLLEQAIRQNPKANTLTFQAADLYWCTGRLSEALAEAQRGVRLDSEWAAQHTLMGLARLYLGQPEEALVALERARDLAGDSNQAMISISLSWAFNPNRASGLEAFNSRAALPYTHLAIAYHQVGQERAARDALLEGWPDHRAAIGRGFDANGWQGMNLELARSSAELYGYCNAPRFADAGAAEDMYRCLEEWQAENNPYLATALNAHISFAPYREQARFLRLREAFDQRVAEAAGRYAPQQHTAALQDGRP